MFALSQHYKNLIIPKGSIAINGISLTISKLEEEFFFIAIIPYTWEHTNLRYLHGGDNVNVEFDIIGKYILQQRHIKAK